MIDLTKTTFLIPVYIESPDRLRNINYVLGYLNKYFRTKVIIHEVFDGTPKIETDPFTNLEITHIHERMYSGVLHRTRQLNEMLSIATTPVVCNYDTDVILPVESYVISQYLLDNELFDVVYPFGLGKYQKKVSRNYDQRLFNDNYDPARIPSDKISVDYSEYGHCIFFNTNSYKSIGGENEEFLSYGPEDCERYERSFNFGLRIHRIRDYVYHFEHERTNNSNEKNTHFKSNVQLYEKIKKMNAEELFKHYSSMSYLNKYKFTIGKNESRNTVSIQKKEAVSKDNEKIQKSSETNKISDNSEKTFKSPEKKLKNNFNQNKVKNSILTHWETRTLSFEKPSVFDENIKNISIQKDELHPSTVIFHLYLSFKLMI